MEKYTLVNLLIKTLLWFAVGVKKRRVVEEDEVASLYSEIERLKSENDILRKRIRGNPMKHHTWQERLHILWHMEVLMFPETKWKEFLELPGQLTIGGSTKLKKEPW